MLTHWWEAPEWADKKAMDFGKFPKLGPSRILNGERIYVGPRKAACC